MSVYLEVKMDPLLERELLECIEQFHTVVGSKNNTKEGKIRKTNAWEDIKKEFEIRSGGKVFTVNQLQKKWNNVQNRVKEKLRSARKTGGGPPAILTGNDLLAQKILGESNPKLVRVPGGMENTQPVTKTVQSSEDSDDDVEFCAQSCSLIPDINVGDSELLPCPPKKVPKNIPSE